MEDDYEALSFVIVHSIFQVKRKEIKQNKNYIILCLLHFLFTDVSFYSQSYMPYPIVFGKGAVVTYKHIPI